MHTGSRLFKGDMMSKVTVIGGGAIGVSCAYYLRREGFEVTVVDKATIGGACSHGNAGLIVPSHIVPLAAPGVVAQGLKWLFNARSPFYIKPRLSPTLAVWLFRFLRSCNEQKMRAAMPVLHELLQTSLDLFGEMETAGLETTQRKGMLMVYKGAVIDACPLCSRILVHESMTHAAIAAETTEAEATSDAVGV